MQKFLVLFIAFSVVYFEDKKLAVAEDRCDFHEDCVLGYCCRNVRADSDRSCWPKYSCVGHYCKSDSECGRPNECCLSNKCSECPYCQWAHDSYICGKMRSCCVDRRSVFFADRKCRRLGCIDMYCEYNGHCSRPRECCRHNKCTQCFSQECNSNSECRNGLFCCGHRNQYTKRECKASCIGMSCSINSDCGGSGECCRANKCAKCFDHECNSNSECSSGQFCCRNRNQYIKRECKSSCIGQTCRTSQDCGPPKECCRANRCSKCSDHGCEYDFECSLEQYCCKRNRSKEAICRPESCGGQSCVDDQDCVGPKECCLSGRCASFGCSCGSNFDCKSGLYCCNVAGSWKGQCRSSCVGILCFSEEDCGGPRADERCPLNINKCVKSNQCFSNSDCDIFDKEYHCCRKGHTLKKHGCSEDCVGESCSSDADCGGPGECCSRYQTCTTLTSSCQSSGVPGWLIGVICAVLFVISIVVPVYWKRRAARRETRRQMATHDNTEMVPLQNTQAHSTNQEPRIQNTDNSQALSSTPPRMMVDIPQNIERQGQGIPSPATQTVNEDETVELLDSYVENRNEMDRREMPSIPPPPYSFNEQTIPSELDHDVPPSYTSF